MSVLDTDILVGILRKDSDALQKLRELEERQESVWITAVNACELYNGAFLSKNPPLERRRLEDLLGKMGLIDLTADLAPAVGEMSAGMEAGGTPTGDLDAMIGAMARGAGESLVTRNVKHFDGVEGLSVEAW